MQKVIIHIISSLRDGGAQKSLKKIINENSSQAFIVVSLKSGGVYYDSMKACENVRLLSSFDLFIAIIMRRVENPKVIVGWMYHGALFAFLFHCLAPRARLLVTYRQTIYRWKDFKFSTRLVIFACRLLNNFTRVKTVYVSESSLRAHKEFGFDVTNAAVVRNGFESVKAHDDATRSQQNSIYFVSATRFSPQKKIDVMLQAFAALCRKSPECRLHLFGEGFTYTNIELVKLLDEFDICDRVQLFGRTSDTARIYCDKHFYLQTSSMEGLSNSIGEAMAWGVVPVCSDVGENSMMVSGLGYVYRRGDRKELDAALERAVELYRLRKPEFFERSRACRSRIVDEFSSSLARDAWREVLGIRI